jgi:hypothetical protein
MWGASDLIECLIFITLALMFVYTDFLTLRFIRRYLLGARESVAGFAGPAQENQKNLVAELNRRVGTLKAIASSAPFLGLAGTCYGILCLFARGYIGLRGIAPIPLQISVALVATASGLIVAIPAAVCHNVLRSCLERLESKHSSTLLEITLRSYGFAQTLPLPRRFTGMPAFALIGAPILAILVPFFTFFGRFQPIGLPVHLLKIGWSDYESFPIVISVIGPSASGESRVYVNSKETPWSELNDTLRRELEVRPHPIVYVAAEENVWWAHVASTIDVARGLRAEVVLLTAKPKIRSSHQLGARNKRGRHASE